MVVAGHLVAVVVEHFQVVEEECLNLVVVEEGFQQIVVGEH